MTGNKFLYKSELASLFNISNRVLASMINKNSQLQELLKPTFYVKTQKLLNPRQVNIICEFYCFTIEN